MTPERLASVLDRARMGDLEQWADIVERMLTQDPHVRSVVDTLLRSIAGSEIRFRAADDARDAGLAQAAADFAARSFSLVDRLELTLSQVLFASLVGLSIQEHQWEREGREIHSVAQHLVLTRDIRIDDQWYPQVRTYPRTETGSQVGWEWLNVVDEPSRWLVHVHTAPGLQANVAGLLMSCAESWLFKRWATVFQQESLERFGSPFIYGTLERNAPDNARAAFFEGLQNLSAAHTAVIEQDQAISIIEATIDPGETFGAAITRYNAEITKAILGSTLNVEIGESGGNRAAAESQAETTILPRLRAIAASAESAIRATWLQPLMAFNAVSFGGRIPPTPHVEFVLETETPPVITQLHVDAGVVRKNELRLAAGLDPLDGPEGERFVQPLAKVQTPSFFSDDRPAPRVEGGDVPLAKAPRAPRRRPHQLSLPTSPTFSRCPTQVAALPFDASGDPER
jgi:phage gp29-like protein